MTKTVDYGGVSFRVRTAYPRGRKASKAPCRALISPINPETGEVITKRQLFSSESDCPVDKPVYGVNPADIEEHHFPAIANELIQAMYQAGLLAASNRYEPTHDLGDAAESFKEMFFSIHQQQWAERTIDDYRRQYDILVTELRGTTAESLTPEIYRALQERICRNAAGTARKKSDWVAGTEAPPSGAKRLNLLYLLIWDLKTTEGYNIPLVPTRYAGKPSRQDLLLSYIDSARSIPRNLLKQVCDETVLSGQVGILADTGLRISEYGGLLFCSIARLEGSQGSMYYLRVTGQLGVSSNTRTEIPKTTSSYRVVPLSVELGEILMQRQQELERDYGNVSLMLMCGSVQAGEYCTDAKTVSGTMNNITEQIPELLRDPRILEALKKSRPYRFDEVCQDNYLLSMLTCHALRRNFCTWIYCESGMDTKQAYQQMGHAKKSEMRRSGAIGATPGEIYHMCLQKHVSRTLYHDPHPLRYQAGEEFSETEVPACAIELTLPANSRWQLIVAETEPMAHTSCQGDNVSVSQKWQEDIRCRSDGYALLADPSVYTIREKKKLFA